MRQSSFLTIPYVYRFCEEDIDQILERRAHVIQLESEANSTFSKARTTLHEDHKNIVLL